MKSNSIIEWAMHNFRIPYLIMILLFGFGIYAISIMPKQEFPEFTIRQGVVVGIYPGATSEEVEEQLTKPLERYLFTFKEVKRAKTTSTSENGMCYIMVELNDDVNNKDEVWSKIKHGLAAFKQQLPSGVLAVQANDDFGDTGDIGRNGVHQYRRRISGLAARNINTDAIQWRDFLAEHRAVRIGIGETVAATGTFLVFMILANPVGCGMQCVTTLLTQRCQRGFAFGFGNFKFRDRVDGQSVKTTGIFQNSLVAVFTNVCQHIGNDGVDGFVFLGFECQYIGELIAEITLGGCQFADLNGHDFILIEFIWFEPIRLKRP